VKYGHRLCSAPQRRCAASRANWSTTPSLPAAADWQAYETARQKLLPNPSRKTPAARYRARAAA
jgi:hypothetical protein